MRSIMAVVIVAVSSGLLGGPGHGVIEMGVQQPEWGRRITTADGVARERDRIRAHLARVEHALRAADARHLTPAQQRARSARLDDLRAYLERGVFPHNHDVANRRVTVFVDAHGTRCAVGELIARSGRTDLVRAIAAGRNLATIAQLADDPALQAWLDESGLTAEEAARIQPAYGPMPRPGDDDGYGTATYVASVISGATIIWNLTADMNRSVLTPGILGVTAGAAQVAFGFVGSAEDEPPFGPDIETGHIVANFLIGLSAAALGARSLIWGGPREDGTANGEQRAAAPAARRVHWEFAPWSQTGTAAGLRVGIRF